MQSQNLIYPSLNNFNHQTPIKRAKLNADQEINTADSEETPSHKLEEVDAQELFEKFNTIVKVTEDQEDDEEEEEEELQRKLDYHELRPTLKLNFEPKSSSMKKKIKIGYEASQKQPVIGIKLFAVTQTIQPSVCLTPSGKEHMPTEEQGWTTRKKDQTEE